MSTAALDNSDAATAGSILGLMLSLARHLPCNIRFTSYESLLEWAIGFMESERLGINASVRPAALQSDVVRDTVRAAAQMWAALEEAGGAGHIPNHATMLLDVARREHSSFRRNHSSAWRRTLAGMEVAS